MDEIPFVGTQTMVPLADAIERCFHPKTVKSPPLTFAGCEIEWKSSGFQIQHGASFLSLSELPSIASFGELRRLRCHLAWLAATLLDLLVTVYIMSQKTVKMYTAKDLTFINQV